MGIGMDEAEDMLISDMASEADSYHYWVEQPDIEITETARNYLDDIPESDRNGFHGLIDKILTFHDSSGHVTQNQKKTLAKFIARIEREEETYR
jgi:dimeric dUTPase (all-alpha-NTP-PPase superfamily)